MDIEAIRGDFPILDRSVNGRKLVYMDNAATAQIPDPVLDTICQRIRNSNANVHRGIHSLSEENSSDYESARQYVADYLRAKSSKEVIFTGGTTDSINIIAESLKQSWIESDEIITTIAEHHSNFIPWQQCVEDKKIRLKLAPLTSEGFVDVVALRSMISSKTRLIAVTHCSNVLGIVNNISEICKIAHAEGIPVLVDGAQGIPHMDVDVQEIGCDFYCFSGHKLMSTTGIGVLYAKEEILRSMKPVRFGGGMVSTCSYECSEWDDIPYRFEEGTPNYMGAYGLEAALKYRNDIGMSDIGLHEDKLLTFIEDELRMTSGVNVLGETEKRTGCISFTVGGLHPFDIAKMLDLHGIAVRSGTLCAQPLLNYLGLEYVVRVSPAFYNTFEEAEFFLKTLGDVRKLLGG